MRTSRKKAAPARDRRSGNGTKAGKGEGISLPSIPSIPQPEGQVNAEQQAYVNDLSRMNRLQLLSQLNRERAEHDLLADAIPDAGPVAMESLNKTLAMHAWRLSAINATMDGLDREEARLAAHNGNGNHQASGKMRFNSTDIGNAERLKAQHGQDVCYVHARRQWLIWDGTRWRADGDGEIDRRAKSVARSIYREASEIEDDVKRKALVEYARSCESNTRIKAMLERARSEMPMDVLKLDADPWLFNVMNGTIDLRTGKLREHRREDFITKLAPVVYAPEARLPLWESFLNDATNGNQELIEHMQRAVGCALSGDTSDRKIWFVHGPGATGKSTFLEAIKRTWGDYAMTADFESFLARSFVGGPRNDIARLAGARFVASIEVEHGRRLAEGLVKQLSGGDTITARFLHQENFDYVPQFKLWLCANEAPKIIDDSDATWSRILRLPFEKVVPEEKRDPKLKATLHDLEIAGPAILAWAVKGCLAWQKDGLKVPKVVKEATTALKLDMDPLKDFVDDYCIIGEKHTVDAGALWTAYLKWCDEYDERDRLTRTQLASRLTARGCQPDRTNQKRIWRGIGLLQGTKTIQSNNGQVIETHSEEMFDIAQVFNRK